MASPVGIFRKLKGTILPFFQIGNASGPGFNANGGALEARNAANSAYAVMRGASPVGDNDLANKQYVDTLITRTPIALQFNGNNALPSNSGTEQFYVVTTSGPNATIGQILWDDGTGAGTVTVLPATAGRGIFTLAAFAGGTISFRANSVYYWDGTQWTLEASPNFSGAEREVRFAITNAASQSSATPIPANAQITDCWVEVTTPYSAGGTIQVGQTGTTNLLQDGTGGTPDNIATIANTYALEQDTPWGGSALPVLVTVGGAPAAGAGFVVVKYSVPDN